MGDRTAAQMGVVDNHGSEDLSLAVGDGTASLYTPAGTTVGVYIGVRHAF